MDRRTYLKYALGMGGAVLAPAGVMALAGRTGDFTGSAGQSEPLARIDGPTMGTRFNVRLGAPATPSLQQAVTAALTETDASMSTYRSQSELSSLNRAAPGSWQTLSDESFTVIAMADRVQRLSSGAFDPSVGALVNLWGFGATGSISSAPSRQAISSTLQGVGAFSVDADARRVRREHAATALDLSGIAKGFGVDRVAAVLDDAAVDSYLVEVGGELYARGRKPDGSAWRVAIERPDPRQRDVFRIIDLENKAIATSGDYRNFFIDGGERYSHTIDPRTGRPVTHELASVSVVADTTLEADAWSTAMMVLGPAGAEALANQHDIAAHFILKSGNALSEHWTPAFDRFISA